MKNLKERFNIRWTLVFYDILAFAATDALLLFIYNKFLNLSIRDIIINSLLALGSILFFRFIFKIYQQIWRYGGIQCYILFLVSDALGSLLFMALEYTLPPLFHFRKFMFAIMVALVSFNCLLSLAMRMAYRYCYKCGNQITPKGKLLRFLLRVFAHVEVDKKDETQKIKIAIVGAGKVGVSLAEDLMNNNISAYTPRCFIDEMESKVGRTIHGIPVFSIAEATFEKLKEYKIQEIIIALPKVDADKKKRIYEYYKQTGCKIKVYDYPTAHSAGAKRQLREFDIEDLLFRKPIEVSDEKTNAYYKDKVILITGAGGSIGSELSRQLAQMSPKTLVLLDIYENCVYDVQQELKFKNTQLDVKVEIASITNRAAMARVFEAYHPQIVINAAAHKHVPLMEHNCIEAIENNIFGTKVVLDLCEEYGTGRFMMVSTDKAVNPTNVMGATKRMCEMLAQSYAARGKVKCSATRFGNVLGSAGSVIPLFKKQIASGGPVTITDKRIIRYFMTIPEASQLVLQSGAMAKNGELFVLDMGQPVKILDLAENMIRLSGVQNVEIQETGLRPGEKLYEELLIQTETLTKTENSMIYIEKDTALDFDDIQQRINLLERACARGDDNLAREVLRCIIPTFRRPEDVNKDIEEEVDIDSILPNTSTETETESGAEKEPVTV